MVGLRYCGGCNPRYDRVELVRRLKEKFPNAQFVNAEPGEEYDAILVVCGCSARCADRTGLAGRVGMAILDTEQDETQAEALLQAALDSGKKEQKAL